MKKALCLILILVMSMTILCGCVETSRRDERRYQENLMQQANDEIGMPNITEFYEKKLAKEIFELRDDSSLICYAYTRSDMTGKYVYLGRCMGYGLPYSTQYTCPEAYYSSGVALPQSDPNGLYSPEGLSATWLWMIDEETGEPSIMYAEPEIVVRQTKLPTRLCEDWSLTPDY